VVKVDDTRPGITSGLNAGTWTVGLSKTGNEVGLNEKELDALPAEQVKRKVDKAAEILAAEGAHYVVDSIADVPDVITDIEKRLKAGQKP
jgi:phosphonoacetaldehyde hydrolase